MLRWLRNEFLEKGCYLVKMSRTAVNKVMQEVFGKSVLPVTSLLSKHEELSEIKLAELLKIEVNEARKVLYRLYNENLVFFKKKKDLEHGWYTYYWTFNYKGIDCMFNKEMESRLNKLNSKLNEERKTQYYTCDDQCMRLKIDTAMSYNFKCPECGQLMHLEDNSHRINAIETNIDKIVKFKRSFS